MKMDPIFVFLVCFLVHGVSYVYAEDSASAPSTPESSATTTASSPTNAGANANSGSSTSASSSTSSKQKWKDPTGLSWYGASADSEGSLSRQTFDSAAAACKQQNLRLPTQAEVARLKQASGGTGIISTANGNRFWTSTTKDEYVYPTTVKLAYVFDSSKGSTVLDNPFSTNAVICVGQ